MKLPFSNYVKAHHVSRACLTVGVLVVAITFFVVGAALRLLIGPVSLGPIKGTLSEAIRQALPGITLDYDQAAVEWNRDQGRVNLVVLGARMFDGKGRIVARAPKADITLAAAPFLKGEFEIRRITLVGVQLTLVRMQSGKLRLGMEKAGEDDDIIARLTDVINTRSGDSSALESFAVRDARLAIKDEPSGLFIDAPRAALMIRSRQNGTAAEFDADVEISGRRAHLATELVMPPRNGPVSGTLTFKGLDLRALAANSPQFASLKDVALVTDLTTHFAMSANGSIARIGFDFRANGEVPLAALKRKILHVNQVRLAGSYDGGPHRLSLDNASLDAREAHMEGKGKADLLLDAAGEVEQIRADMLFGRTVLNDQGLFAAPVTFDQVSLAGDYFLALRRFDMTRFRITAPSFRLETTGSLTLPDKATPELAPGLKLNGRIEAMPVRTLMRYWPLPVAPGAREWMDGNVFSGTLGPLVVQADFAPGMLDQPVLPEDSMNLSFEMQNVEGNYLDGLTRLTGVAGRAVLTGDTFRADFTTGRIGNIVVTSGSAVIPNLHDHGTTGTFSAHAEGDMPEIMTLIDMKPLNYPTRFGINPRETAGRASADLSFKVPMLKDVAVDDIGISVQARVSDFGVLLGSHTRLKGGAVTFDIDNDRLHQNGSVLLADSRLMVDWVEEFNTKDPITTRIGVKGMLTDAAREMLNIKLAKIISGSAPITASLAGSRGALRSADVTADMTPLTITAPIVNLQKLPGGAAAARIAVNFGPGATPKDETIRITGPALTATGTVTFSPEGDLAQLNFPSVKMGALNDLSFVMTRSVSGDDYVLRGRSLDGSKTGRALEAPSGGSATPAPPRDMTPDGRFHVSARLDKVSLRGGVTVTPFNLDMSGLGDRPISLALSGNLSKTATLTGNLEMTPNGRKVTITAGDAGLLARGLLGFEGMRGGQLTLVSNLPGRATDLVNPNAIGPDHQGLLTVREFQMVNQSFLTRLFSAGSLTGLGDLMQGEGISMDRLEMPYTSKNDVISLKDVRAIGPAVGATADGYIDKPKGVVALKGSLVPAYGLNSVLGNIPLLGDILTSKKGEGIFGVTYSMTGAAEHPDISVNPLSVLTPGILRRLFEGRMPNAANAPTNVQAQTQRSTPAP